MNCGVVPNSSWYAACVVQIVTIGLAGSNAPEPQNGTPVESSTPEVTVDQHDRVPAGVEGLGGLLTREARVVGQIAVAVVVGRSGRPTARAA